MSRFVRAFLACGALSLCSAAAAQDIYGSPQSLRGRYSATPERCAPGQYQYGIIARNSYFRDFAPAAAGYVKSHRVTATGFILNLVSRDCKRKWTENITVIDNKTIRVEGDGSKTLFLCSDDPPWGALIAGPGPCAE